MQIAFDNLIVALMVVLGPIQPALPIASLNSQFPSVFHEASARPDNAAEAGDLPCHHFVDPLARHKCTIRIGRQASGAAELPIPFRSEVTWISPPAPGMPFKYPSNFVR